MPAGVSTARPQRDEPIIRIPALGLTVRVRFAPDPQGGGSAIVETTNAPGFGPPLHRRREAEIFEIVTGRYLFEIDGRRFIARRGDLVRVPGGAARAFVNVTGTGARQKVIIEPGIDAANFFAELALALDRGAAPVGDDLPLDAGARLRAFGERWGVVFLGPPLDAAEASPFGSAL
ncbi:cupin domain-containing protein [Variovorax sp. KK3]|uniref:cupin domain-containing protein n=1 Tax=Variovorax sp. KK3 TaxID=1855728 RepID=UPI00097CACAD|nr:cupin domain-containing protein [Variovorax sp. KK3]